MKSLYSIGFMLCFLCAFWHPKNIASEQVIISKHDSHINLLGKIDWLIEAKSLQLSDIQNLQDWQTSYVLDQVNQEQSLWGKFNIVFDNPNEEHYFLTVGNPQLIMLMFFY